MWGMGADGHAFFENARARNISSEGALLSDIEHPLMPGDVIGVQYREKKARFRVVRVIDTGPLQKGQADVQMVEGQQCPWQQELIRPDATAAPAAPAAPATQNPSSPQEKRRFVRHKVRFPIELRHERGGGAQMRTNATDTSGCGCYVETLLPLPVGTPLSVTFWMESEKVNTAGMVRACDWGVGMGIEFTGLDIQSQERLQRLIEKLDTGVTPG